MIWVCLIFKIHIVFYNCSFFGCLVIRTVFQWSGYFSLLSFIESSIFLCALVWTSLFLSSYSEPSRFSGWRRLVAESHLPTTMDIIFFWTILSEHWQIYGFIYSHLFWFYRLLNFTNEADKKVGCEKFVRCLYSVSSTGIDFVCLCAVLLLLELKLYYCWYQQNINCFNVCCYLLFNLFLQISLTAFIKRNWDWRSNSLSFEHICMLSL